VNEILPAIDMILVAPMVAAIAVLAVSPTIVLQLEH
jgi:hypothetical protein